MTRRTAAAVLLMLMTAAGCARQPRPATTPAPPKPGVAPLRHDLATAFDAPAFRNAVWGVLVKSLKTGETLYARNPGTLLMPASNMKIVTTAVAAERLGWSRTFDTTLVSAAPIDGGVLEGDLLLVGSGDPALGGRPLQSWAPTSVGADSRPPEGGRHEERRSAPDIVLDAWAAQLKAAGITRVAGRLIGIDDVLDDEGLGQGWAWDFLDAAYATPAGGLTFNENTAQVRFVPGAAPGDAVTVLASPAGHGLTIVSTVTTGEKDSPTTVSFRRLPGSAVLSVTGSLPVGRADLVRSVAVDDPTAFTVGVVRAGLAERGVVIAGAAVDGDTLLDKPSTHGARTLATWTSPPLADILKVLMKVSQNLYADTMFELVGAGRNADGSRRPGTAAAGRTAIQDTLAAWGIAPGTYLQADGSGLSRYNYVTADLLVRVLTHVYGDPTHRQPYLETLPIGGVDGSIAGRMKGTAAENNARAKTGSISNARALSGFVTSADGEPLVFSAVVNNFNVPSSDADTIIDAVVARLASFRRR